MFRDSIYIDAEEHADLYPEIKRRDKMFPIEELNFGASYVRSVEGDYYYKSYIEIKVYKKNSNQ